MNLTLVLPIALVIVFSFVDVASGRGGRGGGARISVRYSSYRYSYSYRSYRYSYSRYSSGSFRTSSYSMAPDMLRRKGGYYGNKQLLFLAGTVYVAHSLRPRFYYKERGWGYHGDYDEFAVCMGNVTAKNAQNVTSQFMYFVCPSDVTDIFKFDDKYCCGDPTNQFCCDEQGFYDQYGTAAAVSVAVIVMVTILTLLCTCGFCGFMIFCIVRRRSQGVRPPVPDKAIVVAGAASVDAPAYPLNPMQPPPGAAYPTQPSAYPLQPTYPESQPMLAGPESGALPYPSYLPPPQQPMPPGVQPPPYPGPV